MQRYFNSIDRSQISTNRAYYDVLLKKLTDVEATATVGHQIKERLDAQKGAQDRVLDGLRSDFAQLFGASPERNNSLNFVQSNARRKS